MQQLKSVIKSMIDTSEEELNIFSDQVIYKKFKRNELITKPNIYPNEIFLCSLELPKKGMIT